MFFFNPFKTNVTSMPLGHRLIGCRVVRQKQKKLKPLITSMPEGHRLFKMKKIKLANKNAPRFYSAEHCCFAFTGLKAKNEFSLSTQSRPATELSKKCFWNQTFDKGRLKNFVLWFFLKYGEYKTVRLVEELKTVGFQYATKAGISLGVEDLKIPPKKAALIYEAENLSIATIRQFKRGEITEVERFQLLIDTWHRTSEQLKIEVIENFEGTDVLNPVYMMAFSGARGNISQVRQLVGMRGLMSNPQGQIIDFPIRSNFREGLTLTEYIISSYGARKGIVDTALRTANAGYLTRRLVDVAQHVIISSTDCGTSRGIFLTDMKEGNKTIYSLQNRLIGRVLARDIYNNQQIKIAPKNIEISNDLATIIAQNHKKVFVRSPLTCQTNKLVCQLCYGWSLAQGNLVSIGEAVGIVAAQSIGEPGTQLTMRTFHTGGVFSGNVSDQIKAPFDGFVVYKNPIAGKLIRTPEGKIAFLTKDEGSFSVYNFSNTNIASMLKDAHGFAMGVHKLDRNKQNSTINNTRAKNNPLDTSSEDIPGEKRNFKIPFYTLLFLRNREKVFHKQVIAQITSINRQKTATDQAELTIKAEISGLFYSKNLEIEETKVGPLLKDNIDNVMSIPDGYTNYLSMPEGLRRNNEGAQNSYPHDAKVITDSILDTINRAWSWGYAWILSGKIYQLPLPSSFFPIFGDFVTKKSFMNCINWYIPSTFGSGFKINRPLKFSLFNKNSIKTMRQALSSKEEYTLSPRSKNLVRLAVNQQTSSEALNKANSNLIEKDFKLVKFDLISFELVKLTYKDIGYFLKLSQPSTSFSIYNNNGPVLGSPNSILSFGDTLFLFSSIFSRNRFFSQVKTENSLKLNNKNAVINPTKWEPSFNVFLNWFPKRFFTKTAGLVFFEPIFVNGFCSTAKHRPNQDYSTIKNTKLVVLSFKNFKQKKIKKINNLSLIDTRNVTSIKLKRPKNIEKKLLEDFKKFSFPTFLKKDFLHRNMFSIRLGPVKNVTKISKKTNMSSSFAMGKENFKKSSNNQRNFNYLAQTLIHQQYQKNLLGWENKRCPKTKSSVYSSLMSMPEGHRHSIEPSKKIRELCCLCSKGIDVKWKNSFKFNWDLTRKSNCRVYLTGNSEITKELNKKLTSSQRVFWISQPFYKVRNKNNSIFLSLKKDKRAYYKLSMPEGHKQNNVMSMPFGHRQFINTHKTRVYRALVVNKLPEHKKFDFLSDVTFLPVGQTLVSIGKLQNASIKQINLNFGTLESMPFGHRHNFELLKINRQGKIQSFYLNKIGSETAGFNWCPKSIDNRVLSVYPPLVPIFWIGKQLSMPFGHRRNNQSEIKLLESNSGNKFSDVVECPQHKAQNLFFPKGKKDNQPIINKISSKCLPVGPNKRANALLYASNINNQKRKKECFIDTQSTSLGRSAQKENFKIDGFYNFKTLNFSKINLLKRRSLFGSSGNCLLSRRASRIYKKLISLKVFCKITSPPYFLNKKTHHFLNINLTPEASLCPKGIDVTLYKHPFSVYNPTGSKKQKSKLDKKNKKVSLCVDLFNFYFFSLFNKKSNLLLLRFCPGGTKTFARKANTKQSKHLIKQKKYNEICSPYLKDQFSKYLPQLKTKLQIKKGLIFASSISLIKLPMIMSISKVHRQTTNHNQKNLNLNSMLSVYPTGKHREIELLRWYSQPFSLLQKTCQMYQRENQLRKWFKNVNLRKKYSRGRALKTNKLLTLNKKAERFAVTLKASRFYSAKPHLQKKNFSFELNQQSDLNIWLKNGWFYYTTDLSKFFLYNKKLIQVGKNIDFAKRNFNFDRDNIYIEIIMPTAKQWASKFKNLTITHNDLNPLKSNLKTDWVDSKHKIILKQQNWFTFFKKGILGYPREAKAIQICLCPKGIDLIKKIVPNSTSDHFRIELNFTKTVSNKKCRFKIENPINLNLKSNDSVSQKTSHIIGGSTYFDRLVKPADIESKPNIDCKSASQNEVNQKIFKKAKYIILIRKAIEFKFFKEIESKKAIYELSNQKNGGSIISNLKTNKKQKNHIDQNKKLQKTIWLNNKIKVNSLLKWATHVYLTKQLSWKNKKMVSMSMLEGHRQFKKTEIFLKIESKKLKAKLLNKSYNSMCLYSQYKTGLLTKQKITPQTISKYQSSTLKIISNQSFYLFFKQNRLDTLALTNNEISGVCPTDKHVTYCDSIQTFTKYIPEEVMSMPFEHRHRRSIVEQNTFLKIKKSSIWGLPSLMLTCLKSINLAPFILSYKAPYSVNFPFKIPMCFFSEQYQPTFLFNNPWQIKQSWVKEKLQRNKNFTNIRSFFIKPRSEISRILESNNFKKVISSYLLKINNANTILKKNNGNFILNQVKSMPKGHRQVLSQQAWENKSTLSVYSNAHIKGAKNESYSLSSNNTQQKANVTSMPKGHRLFEISKTFSNLSSSFFLPIIEYSLVNDFPKSIPACLSPKGIDLSLQQETFIAAQSISNSITENTIRGGGAGGALSNLSIFLNHIDNKKFLFGMNGPILASLATGSPTSNNSFLRFRQSNEELSLNNKTSLYKTEFISYINNSVNSQFPFIKTYSYSSIEGEFIYQKKNLTKINLEPSTIYNELVELKKATSKSSIGKMIRQKFTEYFITNKSSDYSCMILTKKDQLSYSFSDLELRESANLANNEITQDYVKTKLHSNYVFTNNFAPLKLGIDVKRETSDNKPNVTSMPEGHRLFIGKSSQKYKEIYFTLEKLKKRNHYFINDIVINILNLLITSTNSDFAKTSEVASITEEPRRNKGIEGAEVCSEDKNQLSKFEIHELFSGLVTLDTLDGRIQTINSDSERDLPSNLAAKSQVHLNLELPALWEDNQQPILQNNIANVMSMPEGHRHLAINKVENETVMQNASAIELNKIPAGFAQQKSRLLIGEFLVYGDQIHPTLAISKGGQIIHINNNKITLRKGQPIFISPQAILHKYDGDFVEEQSSVITLAYQQLKTGDIVQGIPKIEQFFEARTTKRGRLFRDSLENILKALFNRYNLKLSREQAVRQSFYKIQQIIIDGVQRVYRSQGVTIADKHLEVIVKQMTSKVRITFGGSTGYLPGEICDLYDIELLNKEIRPKILYEPIVLGITKASLEVKSFLSAASFQQTTRVLTKAALSRKNDYLNGLKENVILGNLIPAGTGYLVYLDQSSVHTLPADYGKVNYGKVNYGKAKY